MCACVYLTVGVCGFILYSQEKKSPSVRQQAHPQFCPDNANTQAQILTRTPTHTLAHRTSVQLTLTYKSVLKQSLSLPITQSTKQYANCLKVNPGLLQ